MPKDSLGILNLTTQVITKVLRVKSFHLPENGQLLLAYQLEKPVDTAKKAKSAAEDKKDSDLFFAGDDTDESNNKKRRFY